MSKDNTSSNILTQILLVDVGFRVDLLPHPHVHHLGQLVHHLEKLVHVLGHPHLVLALGHQPVETPGLQPVHVPGHLLVEEGPLLLEEHQSLEAAVELDLRDRSLEVVVVVVVELKVAAEEVVQSGGINIVSRYDCTQMAFCLERS